MNVDLGIWSKLTKMVALLLLLAGLLLVGVWYLPLIQQNERMRRQILRLDDKLSQQQETNKVLKSQIAALQNDPKTVERLTREKLGYAKSGEIVVRFESPTTNALLR